MSANNGSELRVAEDDFESDGDLVLYQGKPFTGIGYDLFPDGECVEYETSYKDGYPNGFDKKWHSQSQLAYEVECVNGLKHGKARYWYPDGSTQSEVIYEYGIKISSKSWDKDNNLLEEYTINADSENYRLLLKLREENRSL